jgi:hypothetical protein
MAYIGLTKEEKIAKARLQETAKKLLSQNRELLEAKKAELAALEAENSEAMATIRRREELQAQLNSTANAHLRNNLTRTADHAWHFMFKGVGPDPKSSKQYVDEVVKQAREPFEDQSIRQQISQCDQALLSHEAFLEKRNGLYADIRTLSEKVRFGERFEKRVEGISWRLRPPSEIFCVG